MLTAVLFGALAFASPAPKPYFGYGSNFGSENVDFGGGGFGEGDFGGEPGWGYGGGENGGFNIGDKGFNRGFGNYGREGFGNAYGGGGAWY